MTSRMAPRVGVPEATGGAQRAPRRPKVGGAALYQARDRDEHSRGEAWGARGDAGERFRRPSGPRGRGPSEHASPRWRGPMLRPPRAPIATAHTADHVLPLHESYQYSYDNLGKLELIYYPDGTRAAMMYDLNGNLVQTIDRRNISTDILPEYPIFTSRS